MEYFLICTNPKCRQIVGLEQSPDMLERAKGLMQKCPKCGHPWSGCCPLCGRPLETNLSTAPPRCANCGGTLEPEVP